MPPPPPRSTLFPYTTLFRSSPATAGAGKTLEHASIRLRRQPRVGMQEQQHVAAGACRAGIHLSGAPARRRDRSEEHTSELQSLRHLVCRLLLEKKKKQQIIR